MTGRDIKLIPVFFVKCAHFTEKGTARLYGKRLGNLIPRICPQPGIILSLDNEIQFIRADSGMNNRIVDPSGHIVHQHARRFDGSGACLTGIPQLVALEISQRDFQIFAVISGRKIQIQDTAVTQLETKIILSVLFRQRSR